MPLGALDIVIAADVAQLRKGMDTAVGIMQTSTQKMDAHAKQVQNTIDNMTGSIKGLAGAYVSLSSAQGLLSTSGQFEQYATSLKVLSGSAAQAEKSFAWVKEFTAKTPYTLNETMEAFIRLKAYGIDATSGSLKILGDTSAAMGKPLMAAVEAMADAMTGENERLKEFGIRASKSGDTIAYNWIDSSGKAKEKIIQNNSEIIKSTLEAIFNEKYAGMMDEQSKTWVGAVSNLEDTWTSFKDEFARSTGLFDTAKSSIQSLTGFVSGLNENLDKSMPMIQGVATATLVMVTATKGAEIATSALTKAKEIHKAGMIAYDALIEAETKAIQMGTYAQTVRAAADKAALEAKVSGLAMAEAHAAILAKEATAAEAAALAQTKTAYAMREAGVSAGLMGTAMKAIPFLAVAGTVAVLATEFFSAKKQSDDLNDSLNATAESLSRLTKAQLENKRINIATESQDIGLKIRQLKQEYGPKSGRTTEEQAEIDDLEASYQQLHNAMKMVAKAQADIRNGAKQVKQEQRSSYTPNPPSLKDLEAAAKKATASHEKAIREKEKREKEYAASIQALNDEGFKFSQENIEKEKKALESRLSAEKAMYASLNDLADDWYTNESVRIGEQFVEWEKAGADRLQLEEWLNKSMLKLDQKRIDEQSELAKKQWEEQNAGWLSFFDDFNKAMDNQLFDAMTGKWNDFGDWLKDFWSSLTTSIARAASSQLSNALIGGIQNFVIGSPGQASGMSKLLAGAVGVGATLSADEITQLGGTAGTAFTTGGGTAIDAAGQITATGSDIMSIASSVSSLKTAYEVLTSGVSEYITGGFANASMELYGSGILGLDSATAFGNFGYGLANPFSMSGAAGATGYGAMLGGAALGGLGGYALGSIGDKLFGADTKAGTYGAIGGTIGGAVGGPIGAAIGAALGSAIGGMFGSTEFKGYQFSQSTNLDNLNFDAIRRKYETDSWFGSSSSYKNLTDSDKKMIEGMFTTYDYLLRQLDNFTGITIRKGTYSKKGLDKEVAKSFISEAAGIQRMIEVETTKTIIDLEAGLINGFTSAVTTVKIKENPEIDRLYDAWKSYAKSIDKTVMEALSESVSAMVQSKRSFETWSLERSGNSIESLRKQSEWLAADLDNLEHVMGVSGVTIDNFTTMYSDAVKNNFDPTTIAQWQSLGTALQNATNAQDSYTKALADTAAQQQQSAIDAFNALGTTYNTLSSTITNVRGMIDEINGVTMTLDKAGYDPDKIMQAYRDQTAAITAQYTTRLDALNTEMESIKKIADYSKTLKASASSLRYSALSDSAKFEYSTSTLNDLIASATGKLSTGADIADEVSRITDLSGDYAQLAQGYYATQAEFDYAVGTMANKIEALGGGAGSSADLSDIEKAINAENDSTTSALDALKSESINRLQSIIDTTSNAQQGIINQLETMMNGYVDFWGEGSPIIGSLREILSAILSQDGSNGIYSKSAIESAYSSVLGRTADTAGAQYWSQQIASGSLSSSQIGIAVGAAAATNGEISRSDYVTQLYTKGLGRTPTSAEVDYWTNQSQTATTDLASTFKQLDPNFKAFAEGGMVKGGRGGVVGLVGEKNYDELITPLKDSNDPLGGKAILEELKALRDENKQLREDLNKVLNQIDQNTKTSRYA